MLPSLRSLAACCLLALAMALAGAPGVPREAAAAGKPAGAASPVGTKAKPAQTGASRRAAARRRAERAAAKKRAAKKRAAAKRRKKKKKPAKPPRPPATPVTPAAPAPAAPFGIGPLEVVTPFPTGLPLFAPTSVWNAPLPDDAPLDPDSPRLTTALADELNREVEARKGPWINTDRWSVPVYTVGADVPHVRVTLDNTNAQLAQDFASVPMPEDARPADGNATTTDGSLVVYQPASDTLWEFWLAHRAEDGWHAVWGGKMTGVSSNPGYFHGRYGSSGTGVSLLGGLITIRELEARRIDHALAIAIPNTSAEKIVWPARRGDGRTTGPTAIPQGSHFRIDPSLDLTALDMHPAGLAIARAAQRYGMVVRDTSSNITFYAEDPQPTGSDPYGRIFEGRYPNEVLRGFPWDRLQVVAPRGA